MIIGVLRVRFLAEYKNFITLRTPNNLALIIFSWKVSLRDLAKRREYLCSPMQGSYLRVLKKNVTN